MNELSWITPQLIWVIGWMFSVGVLFTERKNKGWHIMLKFLALGIVWPVYLGFAWSDK